MNDHQYIKWHPAEPDVFLIKESSHSAVDYTYDITGKTLEERKDILLFALRNGYFPSDSLIVFRPKRRDEVESQNDISSQNTEKPIENIKNNPKSDMITPFPSDDTASEINTKTESDTQEENQEQKAKKSSLFAQAINRVKNIFSLGKNKKSETDIARIREENREILNNWQGGDITFPLFKQSGKEGLLKYEQKKPNQISVFRKKINFLPEFTIDEKRSFFLEVNENFENSHLGNPTKPK